MAVNPIHPEEAERQRQEMARLMERVGEGQPDALKALYHHCSRPCYALALRMLSDRREAEEAIQDAFLRVWRHADRYDASQSAPLSWVLMITRRVCIDRLRLQRRNPQHQLGNEELSDPPADKTLDWNESPPEGEQREMLNRSLSRLSAQQRRAIELAFFKGFTQSEIAEREERPLGSVKSDIRRGLLRLRQIFSRNND